QHLHEGRIEARLVLMGLQSEAGTRALAVEPYRDEDQRCLQANVRFLLTRPRQKTQGEEQRVGTALLQRAACAPVQLDETCRQLDVVESNEYLAPLQSVRGVRTPQILERAGLMELLAARVP